MKVYIKNHQRSLRVSQRKIAGLLRKALDTLDLRRAELSVLLVNDRRMKTLNKLYRGIDRTTDVLSFPQSEDFSAHYSRVTPHGFVLGDIVINVHKAKRQAEEYGLTFNEEMDRLLIHGLLHLAGYDHEQSAYLRRKMEKKEKELLVGGG